MDIAFLIGRIIVAIYYIYSGIHHFTSLDMMAGYAGSKGVPAPKIAVAGSGALLLPVSFTMHNFWAAQDPMQKMGDMVNFTKNMALIGCALMFLAIPQPWPYSLGY
jgi:uncharacterized membrane protein YphA (DoxX/SURF4 family)